MIKTKLAKLQIWFQEKRFLITIYFKLQKKRKLICKMGDIYFAKLGINIGAEIDKHRPVLVFQGHDYYLRNSDLVFVFPLTTNNQGRRFKVLFSQHDLIGNVKEGGILLYQGRAISKSRLVKKMGQMKQEKLKEIRKEFEKFLYKNTPLEHKTPGGRTDGSLKNP